MVKSVHTEILDKFEQKDLAWTIQCQDANGIGDDYDRDDNDDDWWSEEVGRWWLQHDSI